MSDVNFENLYDRIKNQKLLDDAELIKVDYGVDSNRNNNLELLCKSMVNAAKNGPVKAEYEGKMFVVDTGATIEQTFHAWKEQAWKPFLSEKFPPEMLANILNLSQETDLENTARSYKDAAAVEILVTEYPEYADKLSMLQLLNAFCKSTKKSADAIVEALIQNAKRFTNGEETFPINLENMVTLERNKDMLIFALGVSVDGNKLDKRIRESELQMLKGLEPEDLTHTSDATISAGIKIAEKHKDTGDFQKIFTQEFVNRLLQGKTFNSQKY